ncbi:uncharacterized protein LOC126982629 [Eriocheir sinensis]|uniref:uncharacterized protein LOC126982629 n=1 Tax=Eriocheir sinensis TaxID=95602 RepID=UPI0021C92CBF|nr:uncharacterized protein LOC126982629 [Eriocheir sinensis]
MSYCAQVCDSISYCHAFRLQDEECHITPLYLTSGYSMTQGEPDALPFYHLLSMKHYFPNADLAYRATVTAASNSFEAPTFEKTGGVLCTRAKCPCTSAKNHSVIVDLGASLYVKEVHAVTFSPPQTYSQKFYAYVGDEDNKFASRYYLGQLSGGANTFVIRPAKKIQFVTFLKSDDRLCLCLVQAF